MNNFSCRVTKTLRFGKYPTQDEVDLLINKGYIVFVDLTTPEEITWRPYSLPENIKQIKCPIDDRTPTARNTQKFNKMIRAVTKKCNKDFKTYIHCRGGHGRSAMVAAIILLELEDISGTEALEIVRSAHQTRKIMEPKWRKMGAPQTASQKKFVREWGE